MPDRANVAATFHRRQVDDCRFGYTQGDGRWGSGPVEWWECEGVRAPFLVGDRDCSSSVIDCWREALRGSAYEGALDAATYTGDMRAAFVGSGLFEWHPMGDGYVAQRGDVYLNEANHTAMCQSAVPDMLSEYLSNEHGGIVGGQVGDQTGGESLMRPYYDFPWDGILAYNGKADGAGAQPSQPRSRAVGRRRRNLRVRRRLAQRPRRSGAFRLRGGVLRGWRDRRPGCLGRGGGRLHVGPLHVIQRCNEVHRGRYFRRQRGLPAEAMKRKGRIHDGCALFFAPESRKASDGMSGRIPVVPA